MDPFISRITIFPVKSLDGMVVQKSMVANGGCLEHDREFAMIGKDGNFIIGKTNPLVHTLRSRADFETEVISFRSHFEKEWNHFHLVKEKAAIESWLSDHFGKKILFLQEKTGRFLDIPDISGATVLSTASLREVSGWYGHMDLEETRNRFRATIEIDGVPAFWEDRLFSTEGRGIEFQAGEVKMIGVSPRARCVVPTRNPETGEVIHAFPRIFSNHRAAALPDWSNLEEYGHHYYLTVNCHIPESETGKWLETGARVEIIGEVTFS